MNDELPQDPTSDDTPDAPEQAEDASAAQPPAAPPGNPPPPAGELAPRRPAGERKPGKVTAIAVISLAQGILSTCYAAWLVIFLLSVGLATFGIGCIGLPIAIYPLVVGILAIVYATKLLPDPPRPAYPARWLAIMQMCALLLGDVLSFAAGVANIVLFNDPEVVDWFKRNEPDPLR